AAALAANGIKKGDRVGLYCINSDAFAIAYFGIVKAGATVVPINLLLTPGEISYILNDSGARGLIYFDAFAGHVDAVRESIPEVSVYVRISAEASDSEDLSFAELLQTEAEPPIVDFEPQEDLVVIIYTSGTTGKPKGAMLTHANLAANTTSVREHLQLEPGKDIILLVLPMFHAFAATVGMLFPLLHGCTIVPLPKFEPGPTVKAISEAKATIFAGVPSMYSVLLRLPDSEVPKLESIRYCVSGGAAMPVEVMKRFEDKFGKLIYEGDGPTECSPVTCCNPIGETRKPGSVGKVVPNVEMKIMDDDGKELPRGEIGEICVRGPNVMKGYWNRPEETAESFFEDWFRTGDLGNEDEEGYFFIVDRKKDMIIVNGMNVYPRVVEEVLYKNEEIQEAAVVGEPHDTHGEIPVAYVALKEGSELNTADVRNFCREHLGSYQVPRKVLFLDELPKNATGKILKRELRKEGELERGVDSREEEA
ncbi:MAG: long-chain fatty acid--CoA ligase, partial [Verrucomicrobiota bacterium]